MGMKTHATSPIAGRSKAFLVFFTFVAVLSVMGAAMAAAPQEGSSQTVMAEFANVGPITNQAVVRIGGTDVGTTGQPEVDPDRRIAVMPLNLEAKAFPLYKNATAKIDQLSLIGEKYVELSPGTPEAGVMGPGDRITTQQTSLAEDYQNLVQPLNDPTAAGLASLVRELGQGVQGRGQNVQEIIKGLQPAFGDTDKLLQSINRQNGVLGQIVDQVQPLVNGLAADQGRTLDGTLNSANTLLGTTTVNEQNLRATIAELPSTLAAAETTLNDVTRAAREGETTLRDLRPVSDNLPAISRELRGFTDAANPALKALNPLLEDADALLDQARPLAAELRRTGEPLFDTIRFLRPVTTSLTYNIGGPYGTGPDKLCGNPGGNPQNCLDPRVQGLLGFFHNLTLFGNQGDELSHYVRIYATAQLPTGINPASCAPQQFPCNFDKKFNRDFPKNGEVGEVNPGVDKDSRDKNAKSDKGREGGDKGSKINASSDPRITSMLPGTNDTITQGAPEPGGSATGLNRDQEENALGYLMGGR